MSPLLAQALHEAKSGTGEDEGGDTFNMSDMLKDEPVFIVDEDLSPEGAQSGVGGTGAAGGGDRRRIEASAGAAASGWRGPNAPAAHSAARV